MSRLKISVLFLLFLFFAYLSAAQTATVKRNVNLRSKPSTNNDPIVLLKPPTLLGVLDLETTNQYYQVVTADGEKGWVWAHNVEVDEDARFDPSPGIPAYNRAEWKHWIDADHDCQNTRSEVLIRDSKGPVKFKHRADGKDCVVVSGRWIDPYSGEEVTDATELDIDHMVPLENAYLSGGWKWDNKKRQDYANYLDDPDHLVAVKLSLNRAKGSKGPDEWQPPNEAFLCEYGKAWETIKSRWNLSETTKEAEAIQKLEKQYCH